MPQKKKSTIQDIATKANVSISTVSRVLNGNVPVAAAKRDSVLHVMDELGYQPNIFAQGLARGQSMTIGVLTQNISSPFYAAVLRGILQRLKMSRYDPLIADGYWQLDEEQRALQALLGRRVDGLIVLGGQNTEKSLHEISKQVPLIVIGRALPMLAEQCLQMDNFQGAYQATQHLIALGHRRIAHITGLLSHGDAVERRNGYEQALKDAGIDVEPTLIIEGNFLEASGLSAVESLLNHGSLFSAIFAANDQMAHGARLALFRRGIQVPDELSLVGFDNQASSAYMIPPLTTVRQPAFEIGEMAGQAILHLLEGQLFEMTTFPAELVVRESTMQYVGVRNRNRPVARVSYP